MQVNNIKSKISGNKMIVLIILSIVGNIIPIIILPIFYNNIPSQIPAFVDIMGNPVVFMEKTYISIFRLPIMGILLTVICIKMYLIKISEQNINFNKIIWSVIAFIGSLKMGITSLENLFFDNSEITNIFRTSVLILVLIGVIILVYGLIKMYKNKISVIEYK
jgi:uncharacterized membrane protein